MTLLDSAALVPVHHAASEASTALAIMERELPGEAEPGSGAALALWNVLERLEQALDRETTELRALKSADFARLNETKSRLLLDVSRAVRAARGDVGDDRLLMRLSSLRLKLEHNRLAIAMHLDAVREIANAMAAALMDAESDGTYSARMSAQLPLPLQAKAGA